MTRYAFSGHVLDTERLELTGPDGPRDFEPKMFDVLHYLVASGGRLVSKEELLDNVWGDRFVSESALTTRIKEARRALGDDGQAQWAISTVYGRGYRFEPEVVILDEEETPSSRWTGGAGGPALDGAEQSQLPVQVRADTGVPLVGRSQELERLHAFLGSGAHEGRAPRSELRWVWLLGEPGIGKSRLAAELATEAHAGGADVLFGRCNEDLAVPYQPVLEALRTATDGLHGDLLRRRLGPHPEELARLLPNLRDRIDDLPSPAQTDTETSRYRLFEAVTGWLEAAPRPLLLVVDDAHWATGSTLQLLSHLVRSPPAADLTVVVTARDTAPDENPDLADVIAASSGSPSHAVVRLAGLDQAAITTLLPSESEVDVDDLVRQTAGNPLLVHALIGEGHVTDLRSAVRRRTGSLPDDVQRTLSIASVVGLDFDVKVVAGATGRDPLDVLDDLEAAVAAGLLVDEGADRFRFQHALVRAALGHQLSSGRRARWHGRIATAMEELHAEDLDAVRPTVAHHHAQASVAEPDRRPLAIQHLRLAAARSSAQLSFDEAIEQLRRARSLVAGEDVRLRAILAVEQGEAESRAGRNQQARRTFESAFIDAVAADDAELVARAALAFEDATWRPGRFGGPAVERLEVALAMVDPTDTRIRTHLHVALCRAYAHTGDRAASISAQHEADRLVAQIDDPWLETAVVSLRLADIYGEKPRATEHTAADAARLDELWRTLDDTDAALLAIQILQNHRARIGDFDRYRIGHAEMGERVAALHSRFWDYLWNTTDAMLALYEGDLEHAEELIERCLALSQRLDDHEDSGVYGLRMFVLRREQGRIGPLVPLVRQLLRTDDETSFWTPGLALLLAETGDDDAARAILDEFVAADFDLPDDGMWATTMVLLIEAAVALGDSRACEALVVRFAKESGYVVMTGHGMLCLGAADRYLGMLALVLGRLEDAERHLDAALALEERTGSPLFAGHARLWQSRLRRAQGRDAEAALLARQVLEEAGRAGFVALSDAAQAELASA